MSVLVIEVRRSYEHCLANSKSKLGTRVTWEYTSTTIISLKHFDVYNIFLSIHKSTQLHGQRLGVDSAFRGIRVLADSCVLLLNLVYRYSLVASAIFHPTSQFHITQCLLILIKNSDNAMSVFHFYIYKNRYINQLETNLNQQSRSCTVQQCVK